MAAPTVAAGAPIGLDGSTSGGTAGAIVDSNGTRCLLTCSHVLRGSHSDTVVLRRGITPPRIGKLLRASIFKPGTAISNLNSYDVAVAQLDAGIGSSTLGQSGPGTS